MKVSEALKNTAESAKSIAKVMLRSRRCDIRPGRHDGPLVILANGPSLNQTIDRHLDLLRRTDTMSVNFAPLADVYDVIRPKYHVMADPLFFTAVKAANVEALYGRLLAVEWPLTVFVPRQFAASVSAALAANANIKVRKFNFIGAGGFRWLRNLLYDKRLAMPRPRNVLVPALMCGLWMGYDPVYVVGADHSWMKTISVDEDNNVISVQPHFYKDDEREQRRVDTAYRAYRLDQIVESFAIAFRSYHTLADYARHARKTVYNSTPDSFIDAFPRRPLPPSQEKP